MEITLRDVRDSDLPVFWAQMSDERARHMAAVTRGYHYDRAAFDAHWDKVRSDPAVIVRTVLADGEVAGHAAVFGPPGEREVTYWVDRACRGRGVATATLAALLGLERTRPLHAHAAADNSGQRSRPICRQVSGPACTRWRRAASRTRARPRTASQLTS